MDKTTQKSEFFRSIPVHLGKSCAERNLFRSIPVHFSARRRREAIFPEHIRSLFQLSWIKEASDSVFFRSISVHFCGIFSYLCTGIAT